MAVAFGWANYSAAANNNGVTTVTLGVTNPATSNGTINTGDLLIAVVAVSKSPASDPGDIAVTGFTELYDAYHSAGPLRTYVGYRIALPGDTASFAATWGVASHGASWALLDYTGAASSAPVVAGQNNAGAPALLPSVTPTAANDILVGIMTEFGSNGPYAVAGSMTSRANNASASSLRPEVLVADEQLASASATGTRTPTTTGSVPTTGVSLAITESGAPPPTAGLSSSFALLGVG